MEDEEGRVKREERNVCRTTAHARAFSRPWPFAPRSSPFSLFSSLSSLLLLCLLPACGPSRPTTIPVRGTVTFGGNPPPAEGAIYFAPIQTAEGYDKRPGRARFGTDGTYVATSFVDGDGLVPGTYSVRIECWKSPPMQGTLGESHVPANFTAPELNVSIDGGKQTHDVDVPVQD